MLIAKPFHRLNIIDVLGENKGENRGAAAFTFRKALRASAELLQAPV
jgi:hypothetical protein